MKNIIEKYIYVDTEHGRCEVFNTLEEAIKYSHEAWDEELTFHGSDTFWQDDLDGYVLIYKKYIEV